MAASGQPQDRAEGPDHGNDQQHSGRRDIHDDNRRCLLSSSLILRLAAYRELTLLVRRNVHKRDSNRNSGCLCWRGKEMLDVDDAWGEIPRLHFVEGRSVKRVAREVGMV